MKHLLTTFLIALSFLGFAQSTTVDLGIQYGVNFTNGNNTLTQQYGTAAAAKLKLKDLFGWAAAKGWSESEVMSLKFMEGAYHSESKLYLQPLKELKKSK